MIAPRTLVAPLLATLLAGSLAADTLITRRSATEGVPELRRPPQQSTATTWVGTDRLRHDEGELSMIFDFGRKRLTVLDHEARSFHVLALPLDPDRLVPPELRPMVRGMLDQMEVLVRPTEERREIHGYPARKFEIMIRNPAAGVQTAIALWTTLDSPVEMGVYRRMARELAALSSMGGEKLQQIADVEGFPLLEETVILSDGRQIRSRKELVAIEDKQPAAGTYAPPAGYTETAFDD